MKYLLVSLGEKYDEVIVTDDPAGYVWRFEPINIVDGEMSAWDEHGNCFNFAAKVPPERGRFIVEIGNWGKDGPKLVKLPKSDVNQLRQTIIKFLQSPNRKQKRWTLGRKASPVERSIVDYSSKSLKQLISEVEKRQDN